MKTIFFAELVHYSPKGAQIWGRFETNPAESYPQFYTRVKKQYPQIVKNSKMPRVNSFLEFCEGERIIESLKITED